MYIYSRANFLAQCSLSKLHPKAQPHSHTHSTHMYAKQLARSLLVAGCVLFKILRHVNIKGPALSGSVPFGCEPPPPESEPSRVVPCVLGSRCCITPFDLSPTVRVCVRVCMYTRVTLWHTVCVCVCASWDPLRVLTGPFGHISPTTISLMPWLSSPPSPCHSLPRPHRAAREISANVVFLWVVIILNFLHMLVLPSSFSSYFPHIILFFRQTCFVLFFFISLTFYQLSLPVGRRSIQLTCR